MTQNKLLLSKTPHKDHYHSILEAQVGSLNPCIDPGELILFMQRNKRNIYFSERAEISNP